MSKKDRFGLVGNTIAGTFRVDQVVAEGGFGVVYRAYHLHFRSPVALKCLKIPTELSEEERTTFLEQFRSEAEIQFRLSAAMPHIVRPLHVDAVHTEAGEFVPLMALEWLDGKSFEKIIEQRTFADLPPMPLHEAMELIAPAAQALHEAHHFQVDGEELSVIHRDIKPDNLFVTEVGGKKFIKLLDFGISKVRRAATQLAGHFSQTSGQAPFSPAYGAPEQWVPKRFGQTGPWTDVWGMALTLVEIIKGDAVIVGDHQAMMGTSLDPKVRPSPRSEGVTVSDDVESVFLKALAVDPRYRYQSMQSFWEALWAAVQNSQNERGYNETPSGRRIPLPRMSAPTPWTHPIQKLQDAEAPLKLPPMLAPALLERTPESQQETAHYPSNPLSDLQPVPAAPNSWDHADLEIAPIFEDSITSPAEEIATPYSQRSTLAHAPKTHESVQPALETYLNLELAPTSCFPQPFDSDSHSSSPALPESPLPPELEPLADGRHSASYIPPALGGFSLPPETHSGHSSDEDDDVAPLSLTSSSIPTPPAPPVHEQHERSAVEAHTAPVATVKAAPQALKTSPPAKAASSTSSAKAAANSLPATGSAKAPVTPARPAQASIANAPAKAPPAPSRKAAPAPTRPKAPPAPSQKAAFPEIPDLDPHSSNAPPMPVTSQRPPLPARKASAKPQSAPRRTARAAQGTAAQPPTSAKAQPPTATKAPPPPKRNRAVQTPSDESRAPLSPRAEEHPSQQRIRNHPAPPRPASKSPSAEKAEDSSTEALKLTPARRRQSTGF